MSFYVTMLTQTLLESLKKVRDCDREASGKKSYPRDFRRLLRLSHYFNSKQQHYTQD